VDFGIKERWWSMILPYIDLIFESVIIWILFKLGSSKYTRSLFFFSALAFWFQGTLIACVLVLGGSFARRAWVLGGCTLLNFALDCHLPGCLQVASMSRTFAGCVYIYAVYVSVGPGKFLPKVPSFLCLFLFLGRCVQQHLSYLAWW